MGENMIERVAEVMEKVAEGSGTFQGDSLFEAGMLDSLKVVDLVIALEEEFRMEISAECVTQDNFKTKKAITALVKKLLEEKGE